MCGYSHGLFSAPRETQLLSAAWRQMARVRGFTKLKRYSVMSAPTAAAPAPGEESPGAVGEPSSGLACVFSCFLTILCNAVIYVCNNQTAPGAAGNAPCTPGKASLAAGGSPGSSLKASPGASAPRGSTFVPLMPLCSCPGSSGCRCSECREVAAAATLRVSRQ